MVDSRRKGQTGEYLVKNLYYEFMRVHLVRDIEQTRSALRGDLIPADDIDWPFCIEVKNYKKVKITHDPSWWKQVDKAAKAQNKIPVLWYKYNRTVWRIVMRANNVSFALGGTLNHDDMLFTMDPYTCFYLSREILAARAGI
jgi:hypothetical protein